MKINVNEHRVPFSEVEVGDVFKGNAVLTPEKEESKYEMYFLKLPEFVDKYKVSYNCIELTSYRFASFLSNKLVTKVNAELTIL